MGKNVTFKAQLKRNIKNTSIIGEKRITDNSKVEVMVRVDNKEEGYFYEWPVSKFENRLFMIRELLEDFFEEGELP